MARLAPTFTPTHDWTLIRLIKGASGVVAVSDLEDTEQKGKVVSVGPGVYHSGTFVKPSVKKGDVIYFQKHKYNADTPEELLNNGFALIRDIWVLGVEK